MDVPNLLGDQPHLPLFGFPPLIRAFFTSSRKNFNSVLSLTPRSAINDVDAYGRTALAWAVLCSDCGSVNQLLLCGSDPGHVDSYGRTALHQAATQGDAVLVQLVLAAKVDINSRNFNGETALRMASCRQGGITIMELLLSGGASIESQDKQGNCPLHYAVRQNRPANVQLLLERGANINAACKEGKTALMFGVMYNAHDALRLLLRDQALEYDAKNMSGKSVLDYAAMFGDLETIYLLQSAPQMTTVNLDNGKALGYGIWRRDDNEAWSSWAIRPRDKDPVEQYSAFEVLWYGILDAQQRELEEDPEAEVITGEMTDVEEELTDDENDPGSGKMLRRTWIVRPIE